MSQTGQRQEDTEIERLRRELSESKAAYQELQRKKFIDIFDQPPSMFDVVNESYGQTLRCKVCQSKGGTASLCHAQSCPYRRTQVWYHSDGYRLTIYDVAMFDSYRRQ